jgi:hypothetical protein
MVALFISGEQSNELAMEDSNRLNKVQLILPVKAGIARFGIN